MRIHRGWQLILLLLVAAAFAVPALAQQPAAPASAGLRAAPNADRNPSRAKPAPKLRPLRAAAATPAKPAAPPPAGAQPKLLGQYGDWGAYTASPGGKKICFAIAKPTSVGDRSARPAAQSRLHVHLHAAGRQGDQRDVDRHRLSVQAGIGGDRAGRLDRLCALHPAGRRLDQERRRRSAHDRRHAGGQTPWSSRACPARARRRPTPTRSRACRRRSTASRRNASRRPFGAGSRTIDASGLSAIRHCRQPGSSPHLCWTAFRPLPRRIMSAVLTAPLADDRCRRRGAVHRKAAARALCRAGEAVAGRHVARGAGRGAGRDRRAGAAAAHARAADLALALRARRARLRRDDHPVEGFARCAGAALHLARPEIAAEQISVDGTRKWLLRLPGELGGRPHEVECVYIPETDRGTLCISSQVGCTLNCTFCHTGTQRLVRNLTAGEIVGQVVLARDRLGDWQRGAGAPERRAARSASSPTS